MDLSAVFSLLALCALLPAAAVPYFAVSGRVLAACVAGAVIAAGVRSADLVARAEASDLSGALWLSITATLLLLLCAVAVRRSALMLTPLLVPWLMVLGMITVAFPATGGENPGQVAGPWVLVHATTAVATYGLVTLAAIAGLSVILTQRSLKRKTAGPLVNRLPAEMEAERLEVGLLTAAVVILVAGVATGMVLQLAEAGQVLVANHKTVLSLAALLVLGATLAAHLSFGTRGRTSARFVLVAWVLLTLGFPGVKFVTGFLLGGAV